MSNLLAATLNKSAPFKLNARPSSDSSLSVHWRLTTKPGFLRFFHFITQVATSTTHTREKLPLHQYCIVRLKCFRPSQKRKNYSSADRLADRQFRAVNVLSVCQINHCAQFFPPIPSLSLYSCCVPQQISLMAIERQQRLFTLDQSIFVLLFHFFLTAWVESNSINFTFIHQKISGHFFAVVVRFNHVCVLLLWLCSFRNMWEIKLDQQSIVISIHGL